MIHFIEEAKNQINPMKEYIDDNYIKKSKRVYKSYCEHLNNSLKIAFAFGIGSGKMLIHAFIPDLFKRSTSECLRKVNEELENNSSKYSKDNE
jgi:hypothetical protein